MKVSPENLTLIQRRIATTQLQLLADIILLFNIVKVLAIIITKLICMLGIYFFRR